MEEHIKRLEELVAQSAERLKQAEKQYKNSLKKLEQQRVAVETTKKNIELTRLKIANRICTLQNLKAKIKGGNRKGAINAKAEKI